MEASGFSLQAEALLQTITLEALKSSEIEGKLLPNEQVRSSLARRLGIPVAGLVPAERRVEGVVEMLLDATLGFAQPVTANRLCSWQAVLFPSGHSGLPRIHKAGIAHLWFVTIHPFEDGNGRMARALTELQLARADASAQRFYSLSAQMC